MWTWLDLVRSLGVSLEFVHQSEWDLALGAPLEGASRAISSIWSAAGACAGRCRCPDKVIEPLARTPDDGRRCFKKMTQAIAKAAKQVGVMPHSVRARHACRMSHKLITCAYTHAYARSACFRCAHGASTAHG